MSISALIKKKREEKGISQKRLGEMMFISQQSISKWERGDDIPSSTNINDLKKILGITNEELTLNGYKKHLDQNINVEDIVNQMVADAIKDLDARYSAQFEVQEKEMKKLQDEIAVLKGGDKS